MTLLFPPLSAAPAAVRPADGRAEVLARLGDLRGRPLPAGGGPARGVLAVLGGVAPPDCGLRILQGRPGPGGSVRLAQDVDLAPAEDSLALPFGLSPLAWSLRRLVLVAWAGPPSAPVLLASAGLDPALLPPEVARRFREDHAEIRSAASAVRDKAGALLLVRGGRFWLRSAAAEALLGDDVAPLRLLVRDHRPPVPPTGCAQDDLFG
jgi:hypothetical protein